ncbi:MAG: lysophospholipid acyltransferase family protein [Amphiplicatus sp.]
MPLRRLSKAILRSPFAARLVATLAAGYIRLVQRTSRWEFLGREHVAALNARREGFILAFWHNRLLMAPVVRRETPKRVFMLISRHRDAEIMAQAARPFGVEFIRGSAANPKKAGRDKGGAAALAQMIAALKDGAVVGVTPDGPRGPAEQVQAGVIRLAHYAGAPILPGAWSTSRGKVLNTWDRFFLPGPFSRGFFVAGAPIDPPPDGSPGAIEARRRALEDALRECARLADAAAGRARDADRIG